jgi:hypothetical protein
MVNSVDNRLKNIVYYKINSDLKYVSFHPYEKEVWLIDYNDKSWYFVGNCEGSLFFNQKFFNNFFSLFSLKLREYSPILKQWFETTTEIPMRKIAGKNTNYEFMLDDVLKRPKKQQDWSIDKRWGYSYPTVKRYVDLKKYLDKDYIIVNDLLEGKTFTTSTSS